MSNKKKDLTKEDIAKIYNPTNIDANKKKNRDGTWPYNDKNYVCRVRIESKTKDGITRTSTKHNL